MITELPDSHGNALGFEISGKVSASEERDWIARLETTLVDNEQVSCLVVLADGARWGIEAGYEDIKWIMTHLSRLHRIAIVSDSRVWKWLIAVDSPFAGLFGIGEKHFETADLADAWSWIRS